VITLRSATIAAVVFLFAAAASAQDIVRKVLIVGVDGMRPDAMVAANAPVFNGLRAAGAYSGECMAEDITISGPCWSTILTGVHRAKHGVTDNSFNNARYDQYPHFFSRLQAACNAVTASIVQWSPVNTRICNGCADEAVAGVPGDQVAAACVNLLATSDPDVIFLHFDDVDGAGHANGFSPTIPAYLRAIERVDALVGQILAAIATRPNAAFEDWLIIVTSDHGGTPDGSHGRNIPEHRLTPLIVAGPSSARGIITPAPTLADIPATVMHFLGLPIDPAWGWDGVPVGLDMASSPSAPFACVPPPPPPTGACCLTTGECLTLTSAACDDRRGTWAGEGTPCDSAPCLITARLFFEDFEGVALSPNLDETLAGAAVWSATGPAGWTIDRSGVPAGGVREWRGWSIASKTWWSNAAGDQNRSFFALGSGAVAVADPDEWSDLPRDPGPYTTVLATPPISLAGMAPGTAELIFDSSWRPEGQQTAYLNVSIDGGSSVQLIKWTSTPGPDFKPDAENERVRLALPHPAGASTVRVSFTLAEAGNNWWWAIDHVEVRALPLDARRLLLSEDFDGVALGPSVDEQPPATGVWSGVPPLGWTFDDSGVPGLVDPTVGMTEWEGWAVVDRAWWSTIAQNQRRSEFLRARGAVAVADPDEWDDRGTPSRLGAYRAVMRTPRIPLTGIARDSLALAFDSSWRPEDSQRARIIARTDAAAPRTVLDWTSTQGPNFHADAPNEAVSILAPVDAAAAWVEFDFELSDARNNWWWAIDHLRVTGVPSCLADFNADGGVDGSDVAAFFQAWGAGEERADVNLDGGVDGNDIETFFIRWQDGC
jgi:hypothetical protein